MLILGLDEVGKGDIFGPIIVAGVIMDEKCKTNFKDSKSLRPSSILKQSEIIKRDYQYIIKTVNPSEYNKLYETYNNQFLLLNSMYISAIQEIDPESIDKVIIDKFSKYSIVVDGYNIEETVKAESKYQAAAAASILAKSVQLEWFSKRKDLHKGATEDASSLIKNFTPKKLRYISKLHFRPIQEFLESSKKGI